eukprot:gb/GECH01000915.1/.p1 GENE.gb/GECH01000915.1/~~gb/GECH01000915.1/.p1  ORF type:complete len:670 (+),score=136.75 gb/GECH01000915.1/:1-2010(+)
MQSVSVKSAIVSLLNDPSVTFRGMGLTVTKMRSIWESVWEHVEDQMSHGKGVNIPELGMFSFCETERSVSSHGITIRTPIFVLSDRFASRYKVKRTPAHPVARIPVQAFPFTAVARAARVSRDAAQTVVNGVIRRCGEAVLEGRKVIMDCGIVTLLFLNGKCNSKWLPAFTSRVKRETGSRRKNRNEHKISSARRARSMMDRLASPRPSSARSTPSHPRVPRLNTSRAQELSDADSKSDSQQSRPRSAASNLETASQPQSRPHSARSSSRVGRERSPRTAPPGSHRSLSARPVSAAARHQQTPQFEPQSSTTRPRSRPGTPPPSPPGVARALSERSGWESTARDGGIPYRGVYPSPSVSSEGTTPPSPDGKNFGSLGNPQVSQVPETIKRAWEEQRQTHAQQKEEEQRENEQWIQKQQERDELDREAQAEAQRQRRERAQEVMAFNQHHNSHHPDTGPAPMGDIFAHRKEPEAPSKKAYAAALTQQMQERDAEQAQEAEREQQEHDEFVRKEAEQVQKEREEAMQRKKQRQEEQRQALQRQLARQQQRRQGSQYNGKRDGLYPINKDERKEIEAQRARSRQLLKEQMRQADERWKRDSEFKRQDRERDEQEAARAEADVARRREKEAQERRKRKAQLNADLKKQMEERRRAEERKERSRHRYHHTSVIV